jgi:hypothetical protein
MKGLDCWTRTNSRWNTSWESSRGPVKLLCCLLRRYPATFPVRPRASVPVTQECTRWCGRSRTLGAHASCWSPGAQADEVVPLLGIFPHPGIWAPKVCNGSRPTAATMPRMEQHVLQALDDAGQWLNQLQLGHLAEFKPGSTGAACPIPSPPAFAVACCWDGYLSPYAPTWSCRSSTAAWRYACPVPTRETQYMPS